MINIKKEVLNVFNGNGKIDDVINNLSNYQKQLAKNIANPLFSANAKNKMLKLCVDLHNLEITLYHYKIAKQMNKLSVAQEKQEDAKNIVLEGGISNVRYIWRSELGENTCDECADLDGQEFDLYDDIPPMPHPNCRCHIEIIESDYPEDNQKQQEESCDCWEVIQAMDDTINNLEILSNNIKSELEKLAIDMEYYYNTYLYNLGQNLYNELSKRDDFIGDLADNLKQSRDDAMENADKYYHAKANCEVAQRQDEIQLGLTKIAGIIKEIIDFTRETAINRVSLKKAWESSVKDINANKKGQELGKKYPNLDCEVILGDIYPHTENDRK